MNLKLPPIAPNPVNNNIVVRFHEQIETPLNLIIPERYAVHTQGSADDNETRVGVTTDRRLINPQKCTVVIGNQYHIEHIRDNYTELERDTLLSRIVEIHPDRDYFLYYGAYEVAKWIDDEHALIPSSHVLFQIDPIKMIPGNYLCEEITTPGDVTESGIFRSTDIGGVDGLRVKVIHSGGYVGIGDTIITTDSHQYKLTYNGIKYILIKDKYIAGVNERPYGENMLIEYLPDTDTGREERNEEKRKQRDFMDVHRMFYKPEDYAPEQLPKYADAIVLEGKHSGRQVIVERNFGVGVAKGRAIISPDSLIAVKNEVAEGVQTA